MASLELFGWVSFVEVFISTVNCHRPWCHFIALFLSVVTYIQATSSTIYFFQQFLAQNKNKNSVSVTFNKMSCPRKYPVKEVFIEFKCAHRVSRKQWRNTV